MYGIISIIMFKRKKPIMKEKSKFAVQVGICLLTAVISGFLLLVLAYLLPTQRMRANVAVSSEQVSSEGGYYQWVKGYKNAQSDTYTDASLILNAIYPGSGSAVKDAMNAPRLLYGDDNNEESVVLAAREEARETHEVNYGRYWHGSLVFLKPLLLLLDLSDIRMISMIIQVGLLFLIIVEMMKRKLEKPLLGFFVAIILLNPMSMIICFCFSVEYTLTLAVTWFMLHYHEKLLIGYRYYFYFLINGILFVYFNELSFPMIGFGIPLIVYLLLNEEGTVEKIKKEICFGIMWMLGYVVMWIGKWILAWIFTGFNYFSEALQQAGRYTSDHATWEVENPSVVDRLMKNMDVYQKWPYLLLAVAVMIVLAIYVIRRRKDVSKENIRQMFPYFLAALLPLAIWIALGNGYSYVHYWFTHRLFAISGFAVVCMILQLTKKENQTI